MPPRRISTRTKPGPPRAKRPEAPKGKKKKKPRPGEGGRTLFVTIASAAAVSVVGFAIKTVLTSLAASKKAGDALARAASKPLYFTEHAKERMACRRVSERQVKEALRSGAVVRKKSEVGGVVGRRATGASFVGTGCNKLVVDADVPGDEEGREPFKALQAVFKACPLDTGVITVIDRVSFDFFFLSLSTFLFAHSLPLASVPPSLLEKKKNRRPTGSVRTDLPIPKVLTGKSTDNVL